MIRIPYSRAFLALPERLSESATTNRSSFLVTDDLGRRPLELAIGKTFQTEMIPSMFAKAAVQDNH